MHNRIIIYLSIILSLVLITGGTYFTIDNILEPKGFLFEGIMAFSLGVILLMIVVIASAVGKALMMFGEILEQTNRLNKKMLDHRPPTMSSLFQNMMPGSSMTITDLDTGETKTSPINPTGDPVVDGINDIFMKAMSAHTNGNKELKDLTVKELEKKLAISVKEEDFETAKNINEEMKRRRKDG